MIAKFHRLIFLFPARNEFLKILSVLLLMHCFNASAQQKSGLTNVDLKCMKPRWMEVELKATSFQHGEGLTQVSTPEEWKKIVNTSDEPIVLIKKNSEGKNEYFYNYYAITDRRNIFPENFKLPTLSDFQESTSIFEIRRNMFQVDTGPAIYFSTYSIEYNGSSNPPSYYSPEDDMAIQFWTSDAYRNPSDRKAARLELRDGVVVVHETLASKQTGCKVLCIEDIELAYKSRVFDYQCLLPESYDFIKDTVTQKIKKGHLIRMNEKLLITIELFIDKGGKNKSRIVSISNKKLSKGLVSDIEDIIQAMPVLPYYKGALLSAKSLLTIELSRSKPVSEIKVKTVTGKKSKYSNNEVSEVVASNEKNVVNGEGKLRRLPDPTATLLMVIPANEEVEVLLRSKEMNGYVYVMYKGTTGYINDIYLKGVRVRNSAVIEQAKNKSKPVHRRNKHTSVYKGTSNLKGRKIIKRNTDFSTQSISGLSIGARLGYPASVLQVKHLFNDKYGRPLHGVDATLNIGEWVDVNLIYCYHYNMIKQRYSFKLYAGGGLGYGIYFKESPINRSRYNYYGYNYYNYTVDRRRITLLPVAGMEWTPVRAGGHLKIAFDYRPSIDFLHPSFSPWWNVGWSLRYNF